MKYINCQLRGVSAYKDLDYVRVEYVENWPWQNNCEMVACDLCSTGWMRTHERQQHFRGHKHVARYSELRAAQQEKFARQREHLPQRHANLPQ